MLMIRNIKKIINNRLSEFKSSNLGKNYFKNNLLSNLNRIKHHISKFRSKQSKIVEQISESIEQKYNSPINLNNFSKEKLVIPTEQIEPIKKYNKDINEIDSKNNKFLKKKLKRKLSRIKRKIKRYKFTDSNQTDTNNKLKLMTDNIENKENRLDDLNSKIKNLQSELLKIQSSESNNLETVEIKKLKNKYKKKIKKLRNKLNKFSKTEIQKNNIIELKNNSEVKVNSNFNTVEHKEKLETKDKLDIELQNELNRYKNENQSLLAKLKELEGNQSNESYKLKYEELELKLKHYQEENLRLSNNILQHEKKIEIMKNQIDNFENLKQKLYEQVNNLGDTLLNNDNVESLYIKKDNSNTENKNQIKKTVNTDNYESYYDTSVSQSNNELLTKSINLTSEDLDNQIKDIFSN
jgi:hypothetical protein